jgi:hypothetical protein
VLKFNRVGAPGWWWNGKVLKKDTFGFWQIKLLNTLMPVIRPIDRFLPFPHLSWIMILRRDDAEMGIMSVDPTEQKREAEDRAKLEQ